MLVIFYLGKLCFYSYKHFYINYIKLNVQINIKYISKYINTIEHICYNLTNLKGSY